MKAFALIAVSATLFAPEALAQETGRFAVGAQIGTPGGGVQAQFALNDRVVLRGGYDLLRWELDESYAGVAYEADIDFQSPGAFVDIHPFRNSFFVSGGAYFGDRRVDLDATPSEPVNIGGATFTREEVGRLTGRITLEDVAPFVGVGYDNTFTRGGHWGFRAVAGAVFGDAPRVSLDSTGGTLSTNPFFRALLSLEEEDIQDDADHFEVLPVVQIGLNYRF